MFLQLIDNLYTILYIDWLSENEGTFAHSYHIMGTSNLFPIGFRAKHLSIDNIRSATSATRYIRRPSYLQLDSTWQ